MAVRVVSQLVMLQLVILWEKVSCELIENLGESECSTKKLDSPSL